MCWPQACKPKIKMSKKVVNMAFGPGKEFVLWMDENPDKGHEPKYRTQAEAKISQFCQPAKLI